MASVSPCNLEIMKYNCFIYLFVHLPISNSPCSRKDFQAANKDIQK